MNEKEILNVIESALDTHFGEANVFTTNDEGTSFLVGDKVVIISFLDYTE